MKNAFYLNRIPPTPFLARDVRAIYISPTKWLPFRLLRVLGVVYIENVSFSYFNVLFDKAEGPYVELSMLVCFFCIEVLYISPMYHTPAVASLCASPT